MRLAVRLVPPISSRFDRVLEASRRTKTSIIQECLEKTLPTLEKQFGIPA